MSAASAPSSEQSTRTKLAHWIAAFFWTVLFLLVHVAAPWGLSLLATHHGWVDGRPGVWNLVALLIVIPGIATTVWLIAQHYAVSPQSFLELNQTQKC
jgi:hypothetical protein